MTHKRRIERLEQTLQPKQRIVLVDGCDPPHWMISGGKMNGLEPEIYQGEPELLESDLVIWERGNICLEAV